MDRKHFFIAGSIVAVSWTVTGIIVHRKLKRLRAETERDIAAGNAAVSVMRERIRHGDYIGKTNEDVKNDYYFYKIAQLEGDS